jgi:hypothetical protein
LNNTASQLLAEMGMGRGGSGMGSGGSGYSARRGPGRTGLYGSIPGITTGAAAGAGQDTAFQDVPGAHDRTSANPDEATWIDAPGEQRAGGGGEGAIPVRYRQRVGQYFRRIAEELSQW